MRLRNHETGYGLGSRTLHWLTVALLLAQFTVGYLLDGHDSGHGRGRGRGHGSGHGRGGGGDDHLDLDDPLLRAHLALGATILIVAVLRVAWRRATPLPPWAETLTGRERWLATRTERAMLTLLFVIPVTGLAVLLGEDDLLPIHVASHIAFFVALAAHLGLVLKHQLVDRDRLLSRML